MWVLSGGGGGGGGGADPEFLEGGFRCVEEGVRFPDFISFS